MVRLAYVCPPPKITYFRRFGLKWSKPRVLDVGCGNNSPKITKKWLGDCHYIGADIQRYNNDDESMALMDEFFLVTPNGDGYDAIPNDSVDVVIMNHVVEHMHGPEKVISEVCSKVRKGGAMYIAFPSLRSLSLPSATGTLQFCDDDTHVRVVDIKEISNILLNNDMKVIHAGRTTDFARFIIGAILLPFSLIKKFVSGRHSPGLWYILGFDDHVLAIKR